MPERKYERCPTKGRAIALSGGWESLVGRGEYDQIWVRPGDTGTFTAKGVKLDKRYEFAPYTEGKKRSKTQRLLKPVIKCDADGQFVPKAHFEGTDLNAKQRKAARELQGGGAKSLSHWQHVMSSPEGPVLSEAVFDNTLQPPEKAPGRMFVTFPIQAAKAFKEQVERHVGEPVLLTGGGGSGYHFTFLEGVDLEPTADGEAGEVRAHLRAFPGETLHGKMHFDPLLGSWKITPLVGGA